MNQDLANMANKMPEFITRKDIATYFGSYISTRYLANLDSEGKGPERLRIGRKVLYKRDKFLVWLDSRIREV